MSLRWRLVLPAFGLLLFLVETFGSVGLNHDLRSRNPYRKDFYWGRFRLQTDPLGKLPPASCRPEITDCSEWWEVRDVIVDPGPILSTLLLSGLPRFFRHDATRPSLRASRSERDLYFFCRCATFAFCLVLLLGVARRPIVG